MTNKELLKQLTKIAKDKMCIDRNRKDLETAHNGDDDFNEVAVWNLKDALLAAYELGKAEANK